MTTYDAWKAREPDPPPSIEDGPQYCSYCREIVNEPKDCPYDGRICRLMNVEDYEPSDADLRTERMSAKSDGEVRHEMEQAKRLK